MLTLPGNAVRLRVARLH